MDLQALRAELERLFELDELVTLTHTLLGALPEEVGGLGGKVPYVSALTSYCLEHDALEALCDAVVVSKPQASVELSSARFQGIDSDVELAAGTELGPFRLVECLGKGPASLCYVAVVDEQKVRLKLLRRITSADRRGVQRFRTLSRSIARIAHPGLPNNIQTGSVAGYDYLCHDFEEGETLARRLEQGPLSADSVRQLCFALLEPLGALHDARLGCANLKPENILLRSGDGELSVVLLDSGADVLRVLAEGAAAAPLLGGAGKTTAPEQLRAPLRDPRSDLYALGAILCEALTGEAVFPGKTALDLAVAQLTLTVEAPSKRAAENLIPSEFDRLVLELLNKDPKARPATHDVRERLRAPLSSVAAGAPLLTESELSERLQSLLRSDDDEFVASALTEIFDPSSLPASLVNALARVEQDFAEKKPALLAQCWTRLSLAWLQIADYAEAESAAKKAVSLAPGDPAAQLCMAQVLQRSAKYEELVELLLARVEATESTSERATLLGKIGAIYENDLNEPAQALVAYSQALCETPVSDGVAHNIERIAGKASERWAEVLSLLEDAVNAQEGSARQALLLRMGAWYPHVQRADLAAQCLEAVLADSPNQPLALTLLADIYRKSQRWPELYALLLAHADAESSPERARALRADAADIADLRLSDASTARELCAAVLSADPRQPRALEVSLRIAEREQDPARQVTLLGYTLASKPPSEQRATRYLIAQICEEQLNDLTRALAEYEAILAEDPGQLEALKGLERVYAKQGRYRELIDALQRELTIANTPRQQIALLHRIATLYDEEFLDHHNAALALEQLLELDPGHVQSVLSLARHYTALGDSTRAIATYEKVLSLDPEHSEALSQLAKLQESTGDAEQAIRAVLALAEKTTDLEAQAELYLRAARLLLAASDYEAAVENFKHVLDLKPKSQSAFEGLRQAYTARADFHAVADSFEKQIAHSEGDSSKAKLYAELASVYLEKQGDHHNAEKAARTAVELDAANERALLLLGSLTFSEGRFAESTAIYAKLVGRAEALATDTALEVIHHYVDALLSLEQLVPVQALELLLKIGHGTESRKRAARAAFAANDYERAIQISHELLQHHAEELTNAARALCTYQLGESLRQLGRHEEAAEVLEDASDIDPTALSPIVALGKIYAARGDFARVLETKHRLLDLLPHTNDASSASEKRVELLIEISELLSEKLGDRARATKTLVVALDERPNDRKLLTRLMALYSEDKEWGKLVEVVTALANIAEDTAHRAKYFTTAAMVCQRELNEPARALEFYNQVLLIDPRNDKALSDSIRIRRELQDFPGTEQLLNQRLELAEEAQNVDLSLEVLRTLRDLYLYDMRDHAAAIQVLEAALQLSPADEQLLEQLADLYQEDVTQYADRAAALQRALLAIDPRRVDAYKRLRRIYTETRRADPSFCLCQALYVLKLADEDEERFFTRMRAEDPAFAQESLTPAHWNSILHADIDPILAALFALIEPIVLTARGAPLDALGFGLDSALNLATDPNPMAQTFHYACGVLGLPPPLVFENPEQADAMAFIPTTGPAIALGYPALNSAIPSQVSAFLAGNMLAYLRPGAYLRKLLPFGSALKSWFFAAIRVVNPQFPIAAEFGAAVDEAQQALHAYLTPSARDELTSLVMRLLQNGDALDLKKWATAVDFTADRAGLILAHDLEVAVETIRMTGESEFGATTQQRLKEIVLFTISEEYFAIRKHMRVGIDD